MCAIVVWNGVSFFMLSVKSGITHGGVCSGWLFNLYISESILKLEDNELGCRLHGIVGLLCF